MTNPRIMRAAQTYVWADSSRMLKKSASFVLASLRDSTYRSVRLASSLAAALLDGLFEHPASAFSSCPRRASRRNSAVLKWFSRSLWRGFGKDATAERMRHIGAVGAFSALAAPIVIEHHGVKSGSTK